MTDLDTPPPWYPVNEHETVIVLIRHGESTANAEARFTRHDDEPLTDLGVEQVNLASNSVSVQGQMIRQGGGVGVVHDFALPFLPGVRRILIGAVHLKRSFYLIRHADDRHNQRLRQVGELLSGALRSEVARLEAKA